MRGIYERYFAHLRWAEMFMAAGMAFLAALQYETQQGKTWRQALPAAGVAAVSAMLLFFRVPKESGAGAVTGSIAANAEMIAGAALAPALSRLEQAAARAVTAVDISSGSGEALGALREPGTVRLEDLTPPDLGTTLAPPPPPVAAALGGVPLRGVNSHIERVGDRTVYVMDPEPAPAPAPAPPAKPASDVNDLAEAIAAALSRGSK